MEIRQEIKRRAADIEARIAPFLPQEKGFQQTVLDAMEYSVFAGGKRLRPMLMKHLTRCLTERIRQLMILWRRLR